MKINVFNKNSMGFSIVSVMMAVSITMIGVVAVLSTLPVGYKALVKARKRNQATSLVQRKLEEIKRLGQKEFYRVGGQALAQAPSPYEKFYTQIFVDYVTRDVLDNDLDGSTEDFIPTASLTNMKRIIVRIYPADPVYGGAGSAVLLEEAAYISGIMPTIIDNISPAISVSIEPPLANDEVTITVSSDEELGDNPVVKVTQQNSTPMTVSSMTYSGVVNGFYIYTGTHTVIDGATTDGTAAVSVTAADGNSNVGYTDGSFDVDTVPPGIGPVYINNVLMTSADISYSVDEIGTYEITYGPATPSITVGDNHTGSVSKSLVNLTSGVTYYFYVTATDLAGNVTTDNNGGVNYSFTTQSLNDLIMTLDSDADGDQDENYSPNSVVRILITETQGQAGLEALGSNISIAGLSAGTIVSQAAINAGASPGDYYYDWTATSTIDTYLVNVYLTNGSLYTSGEIQVEIINLPIQISSIDTAVGSDSDENYEPDSAVRITVLEQNGTNYLESISTITIMDSGSNLIVDSAMLTAGASDGEYYYDWTPSVEDYYNVAVTLDDGYTNDTASISVTIQAASIVLDGGVARQDRSGYDKIKFYALNESSQTVTITTMRVVWNKDTKIYKVRAALSSPYTTRKNIGSPGLPSGSSFYLSSNITFEPGDRMYFILFLYDGPGGVNMAGSTTTAYLIDNDDNEYAVGPISVP